MPPDETPAGAPAEASADPWTLLRRTTPARIGLVRNGDAPSLPDVLAFQGAHARARDAVHRPFDAEAIARALQPLPTITVASRAADRATYLRRPDLGRSLEPLSDAALERSDPDILFVVGDGLSALAVERHAAPFLRHVLPRLAPWSAGPIVLARQARVALGDAIGARTGARLVVVLIGERPGLSVSDSLGAYITYGPREGTPDSARNCISNIHAAGLSYERAAATLRWLVGEALRRSLTGVGLKDETGLLVEPPEAP